MPLHSHLLSFFTGKTAHWFVEQQIFPQKDTPKWPGFYGAAGYDIPIRQNWQDDDEVLVDAEEELPRGVVAYPHLQDTSSEIARWSTKAYIESLLAGGEVAPGSDPQDDEVRAGDGKTQVAVQSGGASRMRGGSAIMISSESEEVEEESEGDDKMSSPEY
jgi:hypothetical protein